MCKSALVSLAAAACATLTACSSLRIDRPVQAASGLTSHLVCSGTFVSRLKPQQVYTETVQSLGAMRLFGPALRFEVDATRKEVVTTIGGAFASRAVYRDGTGCALVDHDGPIDRSLKPGATAEATPLLPEIAPAYVVETDDPNLRTALDRAFAEPDRPPYHQTEAVVVVHDGRVVAERYAPGVSFDTPLLSWSVAKSLTNALVGILVRERRLSVEQTQLAGWQAANDPRRAISLDHLLRQTSGLALWQTSSGFDPSTRMKYIEHADMAGFAQSAALEGRPGSKWAYTDGHYMLVSRIVRDAVGGQASDVRSFAQRELFAPLGMRHTTIEFDASGTPLGSHSVYASARDWARLGLLYLNDGVVGGRRILPEGWVRYSTTPTLDTGYGAGLWTNVVEGDVPAWGVPWGMPHAPRDTFFARGFMGQYIIIVPSEQLVIVRFGPSQVRGDDIASADRLAADVIAALRSKAQARRQGS